MCDAIFSYFLRPAFQLARDLNDRFSLQRVAQSDLGIFHTRRGPLRAKELQNNDVILHLSGQWLLLSAASCANIEMTKGKPFITTKGSLRFLREKTSI